MEGPIKKIMVYVDGTEQSMTAARYAIILARSTSAVLTALYVINTRALRELVKSRIFLDVEEEEYKRDLEGDADRYLDHVQEMAREKGLVLETLKSSGSIHQEIKKIARDQGADLLVLPEISRIQSRRDEMYNEIERAMRAVNCPVLISKDDDRVLELFDSIS